MCTSDKNGLKITLILGIKAGPYISFTVLGAVLFKEVVGGGDWKTIQNLWGGVKTIQNSGVASWVLRIWRGVIQKKRGIELRIE